MKTIRFGAVNSIDVVPFVVAQQLGFFKKQGLDVKLDLFKSPKDRDAAFVSGGLDALVCDEIAMCIYRNAGIDVKITGKTTGDFMLIAGKNSGIKTVQGLKGKSVAISEKTSIEYTLDQILAKSNLAAADVTKQMVPQIPARLELLNSGKVDAALMPEPYATMALQSGGILLGSAGKLSVYPSVTAFTGEMLKNSAGSVKAFYSAYDAAVTYINRTPLKTFEDVLIQTAGYPADMKNAIKMPKFEKNHLPSLKELNSVIKWAAQYKLINPTAKAEDFLYRANHS